MGCKWLRLLQAELCADEASRLRLCFSFDCFHLLHSIARLCCSSRTVSVGGRLGFAASVPAVGRPLRRGMSSSAPIAEAAASSSDVKALAEQVAALARQVASLEAALTKGGQHEVTVALSNGASLLPDKGVPALFKHIGEACADSFVVAIVIFSIIGLGVSVLFTVLYAALCFLLESFSIFFLP